ncbi:hypothetical protein SLS58_007162 [Diplodia intermedia]|uniref:Uncharacterized protein n=1 Tax=Diplodia intermedia TaxID=856260 RepID=A0ABR3TL27_9PEZI
MSTIDDLKELGSKRLPKMYRDPPRVLANVDNVDTSAEIFGQKTANWPHPAVKTGMELRGLRTGGLRKPFKLLGEKETAELKQLLEDADVKVV